MELSSFSSQLLKEGVLLSWCTHSETNNYGFEIERRTNAEWQTIGFVKGRGTTAESHQYEFMDNIRTSFFADSKIYYRLKQIDGDGSYKYSQVTYVTLPMPATIELYQNYPNPFNTSTTIAYEVPCESSVEIKIYNIIGHEVASLLNELKSVGKYQIIWDGKDSYGRIAPGGLYFCVMKVRAVTKTMKLIVLK